MTGSHAVVTIWNPDGSTAEMSGNGVRIAARWLAAESGATEVTIETAGREIAARMLNALDTDTDVGEVTCRRAGARRRNRADDGVGRQPARRRPPRRTDAGTTCSASARCSRRMLGSRSARTSSSCASTDGTTCPCSSGSAARGRRARPARRRSPQPRSRSSAAGATARSPCTCRAAISHVRIASGRASLSGPAERVAWGTTIL